MTDKDTEKDPIEPLQAVKCTGKQVPPLKVRLSIDKCNLPVEIDTGASRSVMSEAQFKKLWPDRTPEPTSLRLQKYSKEPLTVLGKVNVQVEYEGQTATLPLLVVRPLLLGRDWMSVIRFNWARIHYTPNTGLHELLEQYDSVFRDGLVTFVSRKTTIEVDPSTKPRYCKACASPYAMRPKVEEELERLVADSIIKLVHSDSSCAKE